MRWLLALLTVLPTTIAVGQVRSVEPIAPGLPFTGPDAPAIDGVLSSDGSVLAFTSYASNLTAGIKPSFYSLYVQTLSDQKIHRVPTTGDKGFGLIRISANGRRVSFSDSNHAFLYDRTTNVIQKVSYFPDGKLGRGFVVGMNRDGSKLLLRITDGSGAGYRYYLRDVAANKTTKVQLNAAGQGLTSFEQPKMTEDASAILFRSKDSRLPKGPSEYSIYRKSLITGEVTLLGDGGAALTEIDAKGQKALVRSVSVTPADPGHYSLINFNSSEVTQFPVEFRSPRLSADGLVVAGTRTKDSFYVAGELLAYRVANKTWSTIRKGNGGGHEVRSLSRDGSRIVYAQQTNSPSLTISMCDLTGTEVPNVDANLPGGANGWILAISASASGHRIALVTDSTNLVPEATYGINQVFVRDVRENKTTLESVSATGQPVSGHVETVNMSSNGKFIAYTVRRTIYSQDFTVVVRDLETDKNVGTKFYVGQIVKLEVSNTGHATIVREVERTRFVNQFDSRAGVDYDLSQLIPTGSRLVERGIGVYTAAESSEVFIVSEDLEFYQPSILRIRPGDTSPLRIKVPEETFVVDVADTGDRVWLISFAGTLKRLDLKTNNVKDVRSNFVYSAPQFSRNGRYLADENLLYDLESGSGWQLGDDTVYPYGVTDGADVIALLSGSIGQIRLSNLLQPYIMRVGQMDPNPSTFLSSFDFVVQGTVSVRASGFSFQVSSEDLKYQYRIGTGAWSSPGPGAITLTLPYDGTHVISARTVDPVGRVDLSPATITVRSDTTSPSVSANARATRTTAKIDTSASEAVTWQIEVRHTGGEVVFSQNSGGGQRSFEFLVSNLAANTDYEYELIATDQMGLATTLTGTFRTGS